MSLALLMVVGSGAVSAVFYLSILSGSMGAMILGYLAPLPLFLAGLAIGVQASLLAAVIAATLVAVVSGGVFPAGLNLVFSGVPVAIVVRQALLSRTLPAGGQEWYPPGRLIVDVTLIGVAAMLAAAVIAVAQGGDLRELVETLLSVASERVAETTGMVASPGTQPVLSALVEVFPAVVTLSWLLMIIVNGVLAQGALMRFHRNRRPGMPLADTTLPQWLPVLLAAIAVAALVLPGWLGYVAQNVAIVLALPFFFAGLGVVHALARGRPAKAPVLVAFYVFLFLFGWPVVLVAGLGVIEQWVELRRRYAIPGADREDR